MSLRNRNQFDAVQTTEVFLVESGYLGDAVLAHRAVDDEIGKSAHGPLNERDDF